MAALVDLAPGEPCLVEAEGRRIVLVRLGDQVYACGDVCPHQGGALSAGRLAGARLACPRHGWMFDVRTGDCLFPPRGRPVPSYPVRLEDGQVLVRLDAP